MRRPAYSIRVVGPPISVRGMLVAAEVVIPQFNRTRAFPESSNFELNNHRIPL